MGPLSPYFATSHGGVDNAKYMAAPLSANGTCTLAQAHILHRHGSRYPTAGAPPAAVKAFLAATPRHAFSGPLAFLQTYEYRQGDELLVPLGREQLHMSGVKAAMDYGRLASDDAARGKKLLVRTGSQQRIVDSALAWATGFWGASWREHTDVEVQIEAPGFNTTLAPNFACRDAKETTDIHSVIDKYLANTTARLQKHVQGATLTPTLVYGMQQLCSYDTVVFGHSEFCGLFTEDDWRGYEYTWDLRFYYDYGAGAHAGRAMGLGWVNELVSRLTHTPWNVTTQTSENATLNTSPVLFPVDRAIYADFTHDSVLTSVLAALQLREINTAPKLEDAGRSFRTSQLVPFAARMVFELWDCPAPIPLKPFERRRIPLAAYPPAQYVRMKLNDAIVPLRQLSGCEDRVDGLCTLRAFLASHAERDAAKWWAQCHATEPK